MNKVERRHHEKLIGHTERVIVWCIIISTIALAAFVAAHKLGVL